MIMRVFQPIITSALSRLKRQQTLPYFLFFLFEKEEHETWRRLSLTANRLYIIRRRKLNQNYMNLHTYVIYLQDYDRNIIIQKSKFQFLIYLDGWLILDLKVLISPWFVLDVSSEKPKSSWNGFKTTLCLFTQSFTIQFQFES